MLSRRAPWSHTRLNLRRSTRDGSLYTFMMGIGERNIAVFGVAAGLGPVAAGLLSSVPLLLGAVINLLSPHAVGRLRSHQRWIVLTAGLQGLSFLPLALMGFAGLAPWWLLYACATLYWSACYGAGSTWPTWISGIVPRGVRATHFARKSRIINVTLVLGTLLGYWLIQRGKLSGWELPAFGACFVLAALARLGSAAYLRAHTDPCPMPPGFRLVPLRELIGRYRTGPGGRLLAYMVGVQLALQVSTPFVDPYLLTELHLDNDYRLFGAMTAALLAAKIVALPWWGRLAHSYGPRALLRLGGLVVIPLPVLWVFADSLPEILLVQLISGAALSAYELGSFLMLFEEITDGERTSVMSWYYLLNCAAVAVGSFIGAGVLKLMEHHAYVWPALFVASALVRVATVPLLLRVRPRTSTEPTPEGATLFIRPMQGSMDSPLLPSMETPAPKPAVQAIKDA